MEAISEFEQMVLLGLAQAGEEAYGMMVREVIERRSGRRASLAAVYATLGRLEERGLVSSWVSPPTARRGGRATKHFALEPAGARALRRSHETMSRMWDGVELERYLET